jgi:hypothetical protein
MSHHPSFGWGMSGATVAACLLYSAPSLFTWMASAVGEPGRPETSTRLPQPPRPAYIKAAGFVFCLEAILVMAPVPWLSWSALVILAGLNAVILGTKFSGRAGEKVVDGPAC